MTACQQWLFAQVHGSAFFENFDDSGLTPYTVSSGNGGLFSLSATAYGNTLTIASQNEAVIAAIDRDIAGAVVGATRVSFIMRVLGLDTDDAATFNLLSAGSTVLHVNPLRETVFDALRRVRVLLYGTEVLVTDSMLSLGTWYRFELTISPDADSSTVTVREHETNTLVKFTTLPGTFAPITADTLRFGADSGGPTCSTQYDEISITS